MQADNNKTTENPFDDVSEAIIESIPNFSFASNDSLEEMPALPSMRNRDDSDWKPVISLSESEDLEYDDDDDESDADAAGESEQTAEPEPEPVAAVFASAAEELLAETDTDSEPENEIEAETEAESATEPELERVPAATPEPEPETDNAPEPERVTPTIPAPEPKVEPEPAAIPEPEPETEPEPIPEPETVRAAVTGIVTGADHAYRAPAAAPAVDRPAPAPDDEDGDELEITGLDDVEIIDTEGLAWKRKQLRLLAEKTGRKLIVDDEFFTAIPADYLSRKQVAAAPEEIDDDADDGTDELLLTAVPVPAETASDSVKPYAVPLKRLFGSFDTEEKTEHAETRGAADTAESETTDQPAFDTEDGAADADMINAGTAGGTDSREPVWGENDVLDYDDVFQDDPAVTRRKRTKHRIGHILKEIFKHLLVFVLVFTVIIMGYLTCAVYVSRTNYVYGSSMEPTLSQGDRVKTSLMPYVFGKPAVGDIVVLDYDAVSEGKTLGYFDRVSDVLRNNAQLSKLFFKGREPDTLWIKRVVAVGGDTIEFRDGKFYRNGSEVKEDYLYDQLVVNYPPEFTLEIPEGYVFVMGDNRNVSYDSRAIGLIPINAITGKMK